MLKRTALALAMGGLMGPLAAQTIQPPGGYVTSAGDVYVAKTKLGRVVAGKYIATPDTIQSAAPIFTGLSRFGSALYATPAAPILATATGASGATTLTLSSTAGIAVGVGVYGAGISGGCQTPGAAFQGTFVSAISGSTVTLSCPNVSALTGTQVQFGIQRNDPTSTILANTVMAREGLFGAAAQGGSTAWLSKIVTGQDYPATGVLKAVSMPGSPGGLVVASRTSDATNGAGIYPFFCLYLADTWATTHDGSCAYYQSNLMPATAGLYPHIQAESSVNTLWPATELDPFSLNKVNSTTHHRFDCGTGQQPANAPSACSTAFDFPANGAQIKTIATVYAGAMDTTSRIPQFASLPPGVAIATWWSAAGTRSWDIKSSATSGYGVLDLRAGEAGWFSDVALDAGTGGGRALNWRRGGNVSWSLGQAADAAGDLSLARFDDSGAYLGLAYRIRRGDGKMFLTNIALSSLPTSASGLVSGDVYRDASNFLKVVP